MVWKCRWYWDCSSKGSNDLIDQIVYKQLVQENIHKRRFKKAAWVRVELRMLNRPLMCGKGAMILYERVVFECSKSN